MSQSLSSIIIGCGNMAGGYDDKVSNDHVFSHAGAYTACNVKISGVYDPNVNVAKKFAARWNVETVYDDLDQLLKKTSPDFVSVCSPDSVHMENAEKILELSRPKIIWMEKPFSTDVKYAEKVIQLARDKGVGIRVTYQRRWEPFHQNISSRIKKKEIGEITAVTGYYVKGLIHIGTTLIDTIRFFLGEPSRIIKINKSNTGSYPGDSSDTIIMVYDSGAVCAVHGIDGDKYTYSLFELDCIGTKGRIQIINNGDRIEFSTLVPYGHYDGFNELEITESIDTEMPWSVRYGLEDMIKSLETDDFKNVEEAESALQNIRIALQARG